MDDRGADVALMIVGPSAWPSPRGERAIELYKRVNEAYGATM